MNRLFDLRFVIGVFFTVIGLLLLVYGFASSNADNVQTVNRGCGIVFSIFGVLMIILSLKKDAHDELLED